MTTSAARTLTSQDGTTISYLVAGHGRPLVIMPGTLTTPEMYLPLVDLLAERHTVVLVSRRGYGATERGPVPCTLAMQSQDLATILAELAEPAVVFGHSFGGVVALSATTSVPDSVARLVLYEPPVALLGAQLLPMLRFCRDAVDAGKATEAVRHAFQVSGSPDSDEGTVSPWVLDRLASSVAGLLTDLECVTAMDAPSPDWAGISTPIALLTGELSTEAYARSTAMLRAMFPAAPCAVLPGQAHFPHDMAALAAAVG